MEQAKAPELRFRQVDGTEFPAWESTTVGKIATVIGGGTPKSDEPTYWNGQINWYTPTEIVSKYLQGSERKITEAGLKNSSAKLLPKEAILLTSRASIGLCSINSTDGQVTTNQGFQSIVCNKQRVYNEFVYYLLHAPKIQHSLQARACGSTFLEISSSEVKKTKMKIPSLVEQKEIGSFFSALDRRITLTDKKLATLQTIKKGMLQKIFSKELRFKDDDGNEFPAWKIMYGEDLCDIQTGSGNTQDKEASGRYPFFVRSPIVERSNRYIFDCEAVLTVGDGVGTGKVFHYYKGKFNCHQRVYVMNNFHSVSAKYFYYYFSTHFRHRAFCMSAKTSVDSVRREMIARMKFEVPCFDEQQKIANYFTALDRSIDAAQKKAAALHTIKKGLLQKMFI